MAELDAAELTTVLEAARRYLGDYDYDGAYALLHPVSESGGASGADLGRVYAALGDACVGLGSLDAAMSYFEGALPLATGEDLDHVNRRIAEIQRIDSAVDAESEGVAGEDEATRVLRAGSDAFDRRDYEDARRWYQHAYDGIQLTEEQVAQAAMGLAFCAMNGGDLDEAEGYLQVAESRQAGYAETIAHYREHLAARRGGLTLGDDGVALSELDEINRSAISASYDNDFVTSRRLFEQMLESDVMPATDRGRVWRNIGVINLYEHDYEAAREALTEAARTGTPLVQEQANRMLGELDGNARAEDLVAGIDLATD
jgi:tetratricopeptide (TPR) repeat protein